MLNAPYLYLKLSIYIINSFIILFIHLFINSSIHPLMYCRLPVSAWMLGMATRWRRSTSPAVRTLRRKSGISTTMSTLRRHMSYCRIKNLCTKSAIQFGEICKDTTKIWYFCYYVECWPIVWRSVAIRLMRSKSGISTIMSNHNTNISVASYQRTNSRPYKIRWEN